MARSVRPGGVLIIEPYFAPQAWKLRTKAPGASIVDNPDITIVRMIDWVRDADVIKSTFHGCARQEPFCGCARVAGHGRPRGAERGGGCEPRRAASCCWPGRTRGARALPAGLRSPRRDEVLVGPLRLLGDRLLPVPQL